MDLPQELIEIIGSSREITITSIVYDDNRTVLDAIAEAAEELLA